MNQTQSPVREAVILVGHGGIPKDYPREKVRRLMTLESQRRKEGGPMGEEEATLDRELRNFPRTPSSDPYQAGIECLAAAFRTALDNQAGPKAALYIAYNEFCAPSVEEATAEAIGDGATHITLVTTMLTPGGSHAEEELPELLEELRQAHPGVHLEYAWPVNLDAFAGFLAAHVAPHRPNRSADRQDQPTSPGRPLAMEQGA